MAKNLGLGWIALRSSQWIVKRVIEQSGFTWELRREGDLKIGLWRKKLRKAAPLSRAKKIVLLPGFGDSSLSWLGIMSALIPALRREYDELVLFEFPGFLGFLSKEKPFETMEQLSARVFQILETLGPRTLIGHSLGGWLAALYAAEVGSREVKSGLEKLVLVDPGGVFEDLAGGRKLRTLMTEVFDSKDRSVDRWRKLIFGKEPVWFPVFAGEVRQFLRRKETREFVLSVNDEYALMQKLAQIQADVRLIWGELDSLFPPALASVWTQRLREKRLQEGASEPFVLVIKGVGHSPHVESAVKTAAALSRALKDKPAQTQSRLTRRWFETT